MKNLGPLFMWILFALGVLLFLAGILYLVMSAFNVLLSHFGLPLFGWWETVVTLLLVQFFAWMLDVD